MSEQIVGREYEPITFDTAKERVQAFARAVGADPEAGVPPTYAFVGAFQTGMQLVFDPDAKVNVAMLVHGEQEFKWQRHPEVGEVLTATARVAADDDRRGLRFLALETDVADQDGMRVLTSRMLNVIRG